MKKKIYLLAGTLFVLSLCSCSIQIFTDGKHQESSSATTSSSSSEGNSSEAPSTPEISNRSDISISDSTADSPSATPDVISSSTSSSDSNESPSDTQVSPDTYTLTRYDSIYDVPYAKLDYKSYVEEDGDSGHYTLTKDGIPWVGTPGTDQFGDICFSDGRNLYIQCFLSYNDTLSTDFRWFCVNFNHFDDEDSHFLPDETMNKLFTGADGETLYTDDGYQYKLSTMPWCQDGTCKRYLAGGSNPKNDCPIRQSGKRRGAAYRTGVTESNPKVFGAEKQTRAWETDHAAAYEAERGCFQHRDHRQQY